METATEPKVVSVAEKLKAILPDIAADIIQKIEADLGATTVDDLSALTEADLVGCGMKVLQARKLAAALKPVVEAAAPAVTNVVSFDGVLPKVPEDESWLRALQVGGVLKVEESTVIALIRAALAKRVGLYEITEKLVTKMEEFADINDEPVNSEYFKLRKDLTRRTYGDIFAAIEGLDGNYVTEARKKATFGKVNTVLWPAISGFNASLRGWQEAYMQTMTNPTMMMGAMMALAGGGGGGMMPGIMQPPDTGVIRDGAAALNDAINKVFSGPGIQIASALAYEANSIKNSLTDPRLPALIGAANRDQMLKMLEVNVVPTYPRLEENLVRFVLSAIKLKDQTAGPEEVNYLSTLYMLGSQIPWDQIQGFEDGPTGIGGRRKTGGSL